MYADDHQLYEIGEDLAKVKSSITGDAEKASIWYEINLLKRNFPNTRSYCCITIISNNKSELKYLRK